MHWNITSLIACTPAALQGVFTKGFGTQIVSEIFMQLGTQSILDLSKWHSWSVNFLLPQLLLTFWVFRMSSLFPCRLYYYQQSLLAMCWLLAVRGYSNSPIPNAMSVALLSCRISERRCRQTWGRSQKCQRGCISVWICRGDAHTHTHAGMCMLRWSWVMTTANISSNFCLLRQQQLLSGTGDGTVPVFPHQWTCIYHTFT